MNTTKLLQQKDITPIEKLILLDILSERFNYIKTSQEIAFSCGVKQKDVRIALDTLTEKGLIKSTVAYRSRTTQVTSLLKTIIDDEKQITIKQTLND